jgi:aminopeptidase YwaD
MLKYLCTCLFLCCTACSSNTTTPVHSITKKNIVRDVTWLASDEMQGRHYRSIEARKAASYIANAFDEARLTPLPSEMLLQSIKEQVTLSFA